VPQLTRRLPSRKKTWTASFFPMFIITLFHFLHSFWTWDLPSSREISTSRFSGDIRTSREVKHTSYGKIYFTTTVRSCAFFRSTKKKILKSSQMRLLVAKIILHWLVVLPLYPKPYGGLRYEIMCWKIFCRFWLIPGPSTQTKGSEAILNIVPCCTSHFHNISLQLSIHASQPFPTS